MSVLSCLEWRQRVGTHEPRQLFQGLDLKVPLEQPVGLGGQSIFSRTSSISFLTLVVSWARMEPISTEFLVIFTPVTRSA